MKPLFVVLLLLFVLPVLLLAGGLAVNRPPLLDPPGPGRRLVTYLTTNVAATSLDTEFPELETPVFEVPPPRLLAAAEQACNALGWRVLSVEPEAASLEAVVTSSLFRFKDDVSLKAVAHGEQGSALHVRSASRVGKGDLAANTRHILDLVKQVRRALLETQRPAVLRTRASSPTGRA